MPNFLQNSRQKLALAWPRLTRLERLTAYFAALAVFLFAVARVVALFGRDSGLDGWFRFVTGLTVILALLVAARYVRRVLMWRLRNRLIVTYVFIGVIPVVLLVLIGVLSMYLFGWQFATYIATSDIQKEISTLQTLNDRATHQLAARMEHGADLSPDLLSAYEATDANGRPAELTAWFRGKQVTLSGGSAAARPPSDAPAGGIVLEGNRLFFRVASAEAAGKEKLVLISSVPLDNKSLGTIGAGLGEISFTLFTENKKDSKQPTSGFRMSNDSNQSQITVGNESVDLRTAGERSDTLHAGKLPPPSTMLDRVVTGGTLIPVLDWRTGQMHNALLGVLTRPSLLYDRLFVTVGQSTNLIIAVLAGVSIFFGVIELLALFIGLRLTRTMTRSIAELYVATESVNRGDLSHRIDVRRDDQMGALERSFNSMTASLERLLAEQKEKQRLENELVIAQEVQAQLFPTHTHEVPGLDMYGICRPARTVSGDYYDFLPFEQGKVAIAAGDVSGKGISAALLMATIHSAVRAYSLEAAVTPQMATAAAGSYTGTSLAYTNGDLSPSRLMSLLNRQLYRSTPAEKYATLFLGTYSTRTRVLNYCNAGHLPPVVLSLDGRIRRLEAGGTVVGLFDEVSFEEGELRLEPGDIVLAYSDGLTEPENDFGEFGEDRLIDLVRENRHLPLERISEAAISAVLDWIGGGEQPDDMTLVLARPA
ncbi:MAG: PP2C family protein-serine/threonine phosphatase [Terriglobales bacterium]